MKKNIPPKVTAFISSFMADMKIQWDYIAYLGNYKGLEVYTPVFDPRLYAGGGA